MEGARNLAIAALALSLLSSSLALLDPLDFLSLQSIRQSLSDPPGSSFFSSWDFSGDPCSFSGVLCAGDRIAALSLGDPRAGSPGLLGSLSPALGSLSALSELSLVPGRVSGEIPLSLSNLTSLQFLALSGNLLSGQIPPSIGRLPRISTVDLSFNLLSGEIPLSLSSSLSLSNLVLSHNRLSGEIPEFRSPSLVRLDLKHNNLSGEVTALPESLRYLSLAWNRLSGRVGGKLTSLVNLNYLDLSMNRFRGGVPPELFTFPLVSLQLQRNRFTGPVILPAEVGIQTVDLSYNRFTGTIPARFAEVRTLYLNNNRFIGEVPARFVSRLLDSGIQVLYLQHNYLTGIQMSPTAEIPTSSSLCLQYNCMVPPVAPPCPLRAGAARSRPAAQCIDWRG